MNYNNYHFISINLLNYVKISINKHIAIATSLEVLEDGCEDMKFVTSLITNAYFTFDALQSQNVTEYATRGISPYTCHKKTRTFGDTYFLQHAS